MEIADNKLKLFYEQLGDNLDHLFDNPTPKVARVARKTAVKISSLIEDAYLPKIAVPDWIKNDKKFKMYAPLYAYIKNNTYSRRESLNLIKDRNIEPYVKEGKRKAYDYVLFVPDYEDMSMQLNNLSRSSIYKHLARFKKAGVMWKVGQMKPEPNKRRGQDIYGVGYWSEFWNNGTRGYRANLFCVKKNNEKMVGEKL